MPVTEDGDLTEHNVPQFNTYSLLRILHTFLLPGNVIPAPFRSVTFHRFPLLAQARDFFGSTFLKISFFSDINDICGFFSIWVRCCIFIPHVPPQVRPPGGRRSGGKSTTCFLLSLLLLLFLLQVLYKAVMRGPTPTTPGLRPGVRERGKEGERWQGRSQGKGKLGGKERAGNCGEKNKYSRTRSV